MKLKNLFVIAIFTLAAVSCSKDDDKTDDTPKAKTPKITGHTESGPVGSTLVINGTDFGAATDDNTVTLSGVAVTLSDANTSQLTGTVPEGAQTGKIKVTTAGGTATSTTDFVVTVEETNQAPTITENQVFSVKEDIDDIFEIGSVEANDEDGDPLTFSIADEISPFEITANGTLSLIPSKTLDYETQTEYTVNVEVTDDESTSQQTITIVVENVPDAPYALDKTSFVITFETTIANDEVGFGTDGDLVYDYIVDWGDGTIEIITSGASPTHTYESEGVHTVAINGQFPRILMTGHPYANKLKSIEQWGTIGWLSFASAFRDCINMEYNAADTPDLTNVTNLSFMFYDAWEFNGNIGNWNVSGITDMTYMFGQADAFNQDLSNWDVSSVEVMQGMFAGAGIFNQNLGGWQITSVDNMYNMLDNSGLTKANYEATLSGWADLGDDLQTNVSLGADGVNRCATEAYDYLVDTKEWNIIDSGCDS